MSTPSGLEKGFWGPDVTVDVESVVLMDVDERRADALVRCFLGSKVVAVGVGSAGDIGVGDSVLVGSLSTTFSKPRPVPVGGRLVPLPSSSKS